MPSKSKSKEKRKGKGKINIKQKQGTHIKIHIDNSKHTKWGVAKMNPRPQPTNIIHTTSPAQPFLLYNNPPKPPEITLGDISSLIEKKFNTIGEKPQTLYEEKTEPIPIGDLQNKKIYTQHHIRKITKKTLWMS